MYTLCISVCAQMCIKKPFCRYIYPRKESAVTITNLLSSDLFQDHDPLLGSVLLTWPGGCTLGPPWSSRIHLLHRVRWSQSHAHTNGRRPPTIYFYKTNHRLLILSNHVIPFTNEDSRVSNASNPHLAIILTLFISFHSV